MGIKIWLDSHGIEQTILTGSKIEQVEREIMEQKLSEIQGQFITDFGVEGRFRITARTTQPNRYGTSRTAFMIIADDAKTGAILKQRPGWLAKFIQ